ncbi:hypothetical protein [Pontibacter anaerobius]|uniref:Uncharacterized protein n=1 Tax=Pontibacter anaerobius TaxID=2993940 RepID=A0ABT3RBG9_9BACT|nr:hypothetical protein [Pontibacter anaerobius]MCX2738640.1 hypothetical protein [Pontibacter anaerobius]
MIPVGEDENDLPGVGWHGDHTANNGSGVAFGAGDVKRRGLYLQPVRRQSITAVPNPAVVVFCGLGTS